MPTQASERRTKELVTRYRCECGAEDSDHQEYTSPPLALICHRCGAGRSCKNPFEQIQTQTGMLQVKEEIN